MKSFAVLSALGAAIVPAVAKLPPVSVDGNAFFADGKRFYMRGVAYQPGGAADAKDPLLDIPSLKRDIKNFEDLGINTIRVYTVDNSQNHDEAMKMLDDAGIYLALDANTPDYSINRETVQTAHQSYNDDYLQSIFATIDEFGKYDNLLLFFSGNEVINMKNNTGTAPYVKAVTRDMRTYISNRMSRKIPVGYSAADVSENIEQQLLYFNCGEDNDRSDFFALNDYSWCDPSSFTQSGWDQKVERYKDYGIPLFLSEYGCITNTREWGEVASLYHTNMTKVYSGGLAYEYTVEPNGFGLVEIKNGQLTPNEDFERLKKAFAKTKNPSGDGQYKKQSSASKCPPEDDDWEVKTDKLPKMPKGAEKFMSQGAGKGPGLDGPGSHWGQGTSETTAEPGTGGPTRTPDGQPAAGSQDGDQSAAAGIEIPLRFVAMLAGSMLLGTMLVF